MNLLKLRSEAPILVMTKNILLSSYWTTSSQRIKEKKKENLPETEIFSSFLLVSDSP